MGALTLGLAVVLGGTLLSVFGMLWVRRTIDLQSLESHHEVAGYLLSVVGTLYAVLLGLVVVDVQSKYQQAIIMAETEANAVADLFLLAQALPKETRDGMSKSLYSYATIVVDRDWDIDSHDTNFNDGTVVPLREMWTTMLKYEPKSNKEIACYGSMLTTAGQLADSRRFRVVTTRGGVSPVLWGVLIVGGISTVAFTYFFGVKNVRAQVIMTALVSLCLSLNVLLVALFSNPYKGDIKIRPDGFRYDKKMMEKVRDEHLYIPNK